MIEAILNSAWRRRGDDTIEGTWAEDESPYEIKVPAQLLDDIVDMQNNYYNIYQDMKHKELEFMQAKKLFEEIASK